MNLLFAVDLNLNPLTIGIICLSSLSFIIMFGISSAKGGYQDLVNTTLENDKINRNSSTIKSKSNNN